MRNLIAFILGMMVVLLAGAGAAEKQNNVVEANRLVFKDMGFSITPLAMENGSHLFMPVMLFLPPEQGFSSNVNVVVQAYKGSLKEFADMSRGQFKQVGFEVISDKFDGQSWLVEYSGRTQGRQHRWYARIWNRGDKFYVVTATTSPKLWKKHAEQLKACVDSFALDVVADKGEIDGGG